MQADKPKPKIVIVEDEGLIAADLEARLKVAGYAVPGTADSAPQALQLIRKTSPDLVLMDIRLKGNVDGIEIAEQVRTQLDIPVVYLTAYEDAGTLERAGRTQAFGYIRKPIPSGGLKGTIEMALAKHRYERELREQRDWAAASFASVPHAVLVTDGRGRVTYLNSRAEELTGSTLDEAFGANCWELLHLYYRQSGAPVQDLLPVAMLHGESVAIPEGVSLRKDSKHAYAIEGTIATRRRDGQIEGTVISLSDVTSSVFDAEQVRQDKKQDALQRVTEGIVRHIRESARDAEEIPGMMDAAPGDAFEITQRLSAYLDVPEVNLERVDVHEMLQTLEVAWIRTEDPLEVEFGPEPAMVQADSWQLTRTLASVLLHARGRRKNRSTISMELSRGEVEQVLHAARIRVSYTTTEDAAAIEQIFEPDWTSSQDLHIGYRRIKKMGGLMAAHLEAGDCATIDLYLPRVMAATAGVPIPRSHEPIVVLVDANAEIRRMLQIHFERNGVTLLTVAESREAVLLAELYPGAIPLVIANLPYGDDARDWLADQLATIRSMAQVRLLNGYLESRQAAAGEPLDTTAERPITKWDLLDRAKESLAALNLEGSLS